MIWARKVILEPLIGVLIYRRDAVDVLHVLIHHMPVVVNAFVPARPFSPAVCVILHCGAQPFDVGLVTVPAWWQFWYI